MKVSRILETCLYADNLDECAKFYSDVLGLEMINRWEEKGLAFRCGQGVLLIFDASSTDSKDGRLPPHGCSGAVHVAFPVKNFELNQWKNHLNSHDVKLEAEVTWANGRSLYFRDPAGNLVELAPSALWGIQSEE